MRSSSSSAKYSFFARTDDRWLKPETTKVISKRKRLAFAIWRILFSEERLQKVVTNAGGLLSGFHHRFALIKSQSRADVVQLPDLPAQGDLEIFKTLGLPVRVPAGLDHRLVRILDRGDVFVEALFHSFQVTVFHRIADKRQKNFRDFDFRLGAIHGIERPPELLSFLVELHEALVQ